MITSSPLKSNVLKENSFTRDITCYHNFAKKSIIVFVILVYLGYQSQQKGGKQRDITQFSTLCILVFNVYVIGRFTVKQHPPSGRFST